MPEMSRLWARKLQLLKRMRFLLITFIGVGSKDEQYENELLHYRSSFPGKGKGASMSAALAALLPTTDSTTSKGLPYYAHSLCRISHDPTNGLKIKMNCNDSELIRIMIGAGLWRDRNNSVTHFRKCADPLVRPPISLTPVEHNSRYVNRTVLSARNAGASLFTWCTLSLVRDSDRISRASAMLMMVLLSSYHVLSRRLEKMRDKGKWRERESQFCLVLFVHKLWRRMR